MNQGSSLRKICTVSGASFEINSEEQEFYQEKGLPTPTLHPFERARRRMAFGPNLTTVHKRTCDATGKELITFYRPETKIKVYDREYWVSDAFDPMEYGRDFDFSRPFFDQFQELYWKVPRPHATLSESENSEYVLLGYKNKNCYLISGVENEHCMYSGSIRQCKEVIDCYNMYSCELCYDSTNCEACYNVSFSFNAKSCRDSSFLFDCIDCSDSIMCVGLRHKQYCIKNVQYTKEEYEEKRKAFKYSSREHLKAHRREFDELLKDCVVAANNNMNCENVLGDYMKNSKDCFLCYQGSDADHARYCMPLCNRIKYSYDTSAGGAENCVEVPSGKGPVECYFCYELRGGGSHMQYCVDILAEGHELFGCVGFKSPKSYCILNKQYTKEAYIELKEKIIAHMKETGEYGEFFPMHMSLFPYEDSIANEFRPITNALRIENTHYGKVEGINGNYLIHLGDQIRFSRDVLKTTIASDSTVYLEDEQMREQLLTTVHSCEITGRNYMITGPELSFYLKMKLPVPTVSVYGRYPELSKKIMRFDLFQVACHTCNKKTYTTMDVSRFKGMLCEECSGRG